MPKSLKLILYSTLILFSVLTIIGLLLPPVTRVSRTKDIEVPADSIRPIIFQIEQWEKWIPGADSVGITVKDYDETKFVKTTGKLQCSRIKRTIVLYFDSGAKMAPQGHYVHLKF